ncbi:serine/threonine-protein phosphatase 7 long form homolog [Tripterygium wilfordii]|uniref:serine/threonine-protein phosphatase 7 long form homolog n=1 Tax=Tripterygium wilfordii TaxID=458696 RepID=UPI0018F7F82C|nr:serine/threonine-protein phosphatase 7 long form homolog [Tripterygium wilfordii]
MVVVDDAQRRKREGRPKSTRLRNDMDAWEGRTANKCSVQGADGWRGHRVEDHRVMLEYPVSALLGSLILVQTINLFFICSQTIVRKTFGVDRYITINTLKLMFNYLCALLGLRVDGLAVTGSSIYEWDDVMMQLLGRVANTEDRDGASLSLSWLVLNFGEHNPPAEDAPEVVLQQYARAYILAMFGSILFPSTMGDSIPLIFLPLLANLQETSSYSWGGAVLACLYRNLCRGCLSYTRTIGGCSLLLQLWSWERLHVCRPQMDTGAPPIFVPDEPPRPLGASWHGRRTYRRNPKQVLIFARDELDQQEPNQVQWMPYTPGRLANAPVICIDGSRIWRAVVPLICFEIVEFQFPDRVMRQFGISQHMPTPVDTNDTLHNLNRRGRDNVDWVVKNATWLAYWDDKLAHIAQERFPRTSVGEYMHWYYSITRRIISAPSTDRPQTNLAYAQRGSRIRRVAALALEGAKKAVFALRDALNDSTVAIANNCSYLMKYFAGYGFLDMYLYFWHVGFFSFFFPVFVDHANMVGVTEEKWMITPTMLA